MSNTGAADISASNQTRIEKDFLGKKEVSNSVYYGIQTLRALENFDISGIPIRVFPELVQGLAFVKMAAVRANADLGLIDQTKAKAIADACQEIIDGKLHEHFVVDMIQ